MIQKFFRAYKKYFFVGGATLLIACALIFLGISLLTTPTPSSQTVPTSETASLSPYLQTTIGSEEKNLESFPGFKSKAPRSKNETQYTFSSPILLYDNTIVTDQGKVIYEKAITVDPGYTHPTISSYESRFGKPELVVKGSKTYGEFAKTYIYSQKGFALIGNPFTDEVYEIQQFKPMTVEEYMVLWGKDIDRTQSAKENINPESTSVPN